MLFLDSNSVVSIKFEEDTNLNSPSPTNKPICYITSLQDYTNAAVGTDIFNTVMGEYNLQYSYLASPTTLGGNPSQAVETTSMPPIIGFDNVGTGNAFPRIYTHTHTGGRVTMELINDDPTGPVTGSFADSQNAQFGGYYNAQYITTNSCVSNISQQNAFDASYLNRYDFSSIELIQDNQLVTPNTRVINKLEFMLGWVAQNDVTYTTPTGSLVNAISMESLFGIKMPNSVLPFQLTGLTISNIYQWIYHNENLVTFVLNYRGDPTELEDAERDWERGANITFSGVFQQPK